MNSSLKQLFANLTDSQLNNLMQFYNIAIPENYIFSNINIVIGPNGSGKTRFLNLLKDAYHLNNSNNIIYGYFPSLSDKKNFDRPDEEADYTLFDTLSDPQATFKDFLNAIEKYNDYFILDLLQYLEHRGRVQKSRSKKALQTIIDWFYELTNKKLQINKDVIVVVNNENSIETLEDALKGFSPGELILFYISIFISLQDNNRKNKTIILDEPECHLHPQVLIKFIKYMCDRDDYATIWIATHSLFIVPEFKFENIIFIKENAIISRKSDMYTLLISEMLGTYNKNADFFAALSQWQFCNYIAECFTNPDIIENINPLDEQVQLFVNYLNKNSVHSILDFGGGSARLGLSLKLLLGEQFLTKYEYSIYDPKPVYTGKDFKVYNDLSGIKKSYDCIVMMNVLHEIPPNEWTIIFKRIYDLLKKEGFLIFVETSILSKGELPNSIGYLVLGNEELKILFNESEYFSDIHIKSNQKSICTIIPKHSLLNISAKTITKTIIALEQNALKEIKSLRNSLNDEKNARKYAFYSQLYINAKLFNDSNNFAKNSKSNIDITSIQSVKTVLSSLCNNYDNYDFDTSRIIKKSEKSALRTIELLEKGIFVSENNKEYLWQNILLLEKNHVSKNIIASLLRINSMAGHKKSKNRLENQYSKY